MGVGRIWRFFKPLIWTMRGLKKKRTVILQGYQLYHNYIRSDESLNGKTPSEACGIKVEGKNNWITLIQNASETNNKILIA